MVENSNFELVELFISNGIGINVRDMDGKSALDIANEKGYTVIADYLKQNGFDS